MHGATNLHVESIVRLTDRAQYFFDRNARTQFENTIFVYLVTLKLKV